MVRLRGLPQMNAARAKATSRCARASLRTEPVHEGERRLPGPWPNAMPSAVPT